MNGSSIGLGGGMGVAPAMTDQAADAKNSPSDDTPKSEIASPSLSSAANPPFPQLGRRRTKWNRQNKTSSSSFRNPIHTTKINYSTVASPTASTKADGATSDVGAFKDITAIQSNQLLKAEEKREEAERAEKERGEEEEKKLDREKEAKDRELAEKLQTLEEDTARKANASQMTESSDGKAVLAVQDIIAMVKTAKKKFIDNNPALQHYNVEAVAIDDMFFMAKNMLNKQQDCIRDQLPSNIGMSRRFSLCIFVVQENLP